MLHFLFLLLAIGLTSCSSTEDAFGDNTRCNNQVAEYVDRHHDEYLFRPTPPLWQPPERYSWEAEGSGKHLRITKDFFRCRGCELNPVKPIEQSDGKLSYCYDCGGADRHSLPLREGKEYIYPILIDLLNEIQEQTGKRVVITSGHRCPEHNRYVDSSAANTSSKHMIGAEVSFYVQGLEEHPEVILQHIFNHYTKTSKYNGGKEWVDFLRYDKDTDVSTRPWYNQEIFVKLHQRNEGRDFDNRHPYSYISIQVRYDWDKKERVQYVWRDAHRNYLRW